MARLGRGVIAGLSLPAYALATFFALGHGVPEEGADVCARMMLGVGLTLVLGIVSVLARETVCVSPRDTGCRYKNLGRVLDGMAGAAMISSPRGNLDVTLKGIGVRRANVRPN